MCTSNFRSCGAIIAVLCCIAVVIGGNQENKSNAEQSTRIIRGHSAKRGKTGFIAQIRNKSEFDGKNAQGFACPATIISERHVVTAAHCLGKTDPDNYKVVFAQNELNPIIPENKSLKTRGVQDIIIHPDYNESGNKTYHADIAVLKLKSKIGFGKFTWKVDLCDGPLEDDTELIIYGWGRTVDDNSPQVYTNALLEATVPVVPMAQCEAVHEEGEITDLMFCAGLRDGKDSCQGDSGGPAMRGNKLCGIISWGYKCGSDIFPGIYTNITAVRDFIEESMQQ